MLTLHNYFNKWGRNWCLS